MRQPSRRKVAKRSKPQWRQLEDKGRREESATTVEEKGPPFAAAVEEEACHCRGRLAVETATVKMKPAICSNH